MSLGINPVGESINSLGIIFRKQAHKNYTPPKKSFAEFWFGNNNQRIDVQDYTFFTESTINPNTPPPDSLSMSVTPPPSKNNGVKIKIVEKTKSILNSALELFKKIPEGKGIKEQGGVAIGTTAAVKGEYEPVFGGLIWVKGTKNQIPENVNIGVKDVLDWVKALIKGSRTTNKSNDPKEVVIYNAKGEVLDAKLSWVDPNTNQQHLFTSDQASVIFELSNAWKIKPARAKAAELDLVSQKIVVTSDKAVIPQKLKKSLTAKLEIVNEIAGKNSAEASVSLYNSLREMNYEENGFSAEVINKVKKAASRETRVTDASGRKTEADIARDEYILKMGEEKIEIQKDVTRRMREGERGVKPNYDKLSLVALSYIGDKSNVTFDVFKLNAERSGYTGNNLDIVKPFFDSNGGTVTHRELLTFIADTEMNPVKVQETITANTSKIKVFINDIKNNVASWNPLSDFKERYLEPINSIKVNFKKFISEPLLNTSTMVPSETGGLSTFAGMKIANGKGLVRKFGGLLYLVEPTTLTSTQKTQKLKQLGIDQTYEELVKSPMPGAYKILKKVATDQEIAEEFPKLVLLEKPSYYLELYKVKYDTTYTEFVSNFPSLDEASLEIVNHIWVYGQQDYARDSQDHIYLLEKLSTPKEIIDLHALNPETVDETSPIIYKKTNTGDEQVSSTASIYTKIANTVMNQSSLIKIIDPFKIVKNISAALEAIILVIKHVEDTPRCNDPSSYLVPGMGCQDNTDTKTEPEIPVTGGSPTVSITPTLAPTPTTSSISSQKITLSPHYDQNNPPDLTPSARAIYAATKKCQDSFLSTNPNTQITGEKMSQCFCDQVSNSCTDERELLISNYLKDTYNNGGFGSQDAIKIFELSYGTGVTLSRNQLIGNGWIKYLDSNNNPIYMSCIKDEALTVGFLPGDIITSSSGDISVCENPISTPDPNNPEIIIRSCTSIGADPITKLLTKKVVTSEESWNIQRSYSYKDFGTCWQH